MPFGIYGAALFQCAVTAFLLVALSETVLPEEPRRSTSVALLAVLAVAASPSAFHIVTLMPDVTALWIGLALPLVALAPSASVAWSAGALAAAATTFHGSNLPILLVMVPLALSVARLAGQPLSRPAVILAAAVLVQPLALAWNSSRAGLGFVPRPTGSDIFLAARLHEAGFLAPAFHEIAATSAPKVPREVADSWARRLDTQPRTIEGLLRATDSPLNRDFPAWRDEPGEYGQATAVLGPALRLGLRRHAVDLVRGGVANAVEMASGRFLFSGFVRHDERSGVQQVLAERWGRNIARCREGRQGRGELPDVALAGFVRAWAFLTPIVGVLTLVLTVGLLGPAALRRKRRPKLSVAEAAALLLALGVAVDVFVCGTLSGSFPRFLERVIALSLVSFVIVSATPRDRRPLS